MLEEVCLVLCCLVSGVVTLTYDGKTSSACATVSSVNTSKFSFVIRTRQSRAFVMAAHRSINEEYFKVLLTDGKLQFDVKYSGGINASQIGETLVNNGEFMTVTLERLITNKTKITTGNHTSESDHDLLAAQWKTLLASGVQIKIGKGENSSEPAFHGCLSDIKVSDNTLSVVDKNTRDGCESEMECVPSDCPNGECVDIFNAYKCKCNEFYTLKNCNATVNVSCGFKDLCQNGANCKTLTQGVVANFSNYGMDFFRCECSLGYEGYLCESKTNECASKPCQNGGVCTDLQLDYNCNCTTGWTGKTCTTNIDDCDPNPCGENSTCVDKVGDYFCRCDNLHFEGRNCTENRNECNDTKTCLNGGICVDTIRSFNCTCKGEFFGDRCQYSNTDLCEQENPCKNTAACKDGPLGANCTCTDGFTGVYCNEDFNECVELAPCKNNATCEDSHTRNDTQIGYKCHCTKLFTGAKCADPVKITAKDDDNKIKIIIGVVVAVVVLIIIILVILLVRYCKDRSGMEGTYSPNSAEQQNGQIEINTLKKPNAERLI